jgi:hypothetical protein
VVENVPRRSTAQRTEVDRAASDLQPRESHCLAAGHGQEDTSRNGRVLICPLTNAQHPPDPALILSVSGPYCYVAFAVPIPGCCIIGHAAREDRAAVGDLRLCGGARTKHHRSLTVRRYDSRKRNPALILSGFTGPLRVMDLFSPIPLT